MDDALRRLRDSSIAAALNELTIRAQNETFDDTLALEEMPEVPPDIAAACEALADIGQRPTTSSVMTHLEEMDGANLNRDEVRQHVRDWKARQWKSREVARAYRAYCRLDAEQRAAFFTRLEIDAMPDPQVEAGASNYSLAIRLNDGAELSQSATRRTTAWIRYHNVRDRLRPRVVEIILREHLADGTERVLRHWQKRTKREFPTAGLVADES